VIQAPHPAASVDEDPDPSHVTSRSSSLGCDLIAR